MIKLAQGDTGQFVIELTENGIPIDIPMGYELTYTISTRNGNELKYRVSTATKTITHIGVGVYICYLPFEVSKSLTNEFNVGELAIFQTNKEVVNISLNKAEIKVSSNSINHQI